MRERLAKLGLLADQQLTATRAIRDQIDDYIEACIFEGQSKMHVSIKKSQLKRLIGFVKAQKLLDLQPDRVSEYLQHLKTIVRSHRTINQNRGTAVSFLNWCQQYGRTERHILQHLPRLDEADDQRRFRRAATDDEINRLLFAAPPNRRMIYLMALLTGLRRGELRQIEWRDIDLTKKTLTERREISKAKKAKIVPFHPDLVPVLRNINGKTQEPDCSTPYLA